MITPWLRAFPYIKDGVCFFENFRTRAQAKSRIFEYIEAFYNRTRRHSVLGNMSPMAFEQANVA